MAPIDNKVGVALDTMTMCKLHWTMTVTRWKLYWIIALTDNKVRVVKEIYKLQIVQDRGAHR